MDELDLGITPERNTSSEVCCDKSMSAEYPTLCFRDKHADLFKEKYGPCSTDDEYECTVRLKVKAFSDGPDSYDKRIEFNVVSIIGDVVEESTDEETEKPPTKSANRKLSTKSK